MPREIEDLPSTSTIEQRTESTGASKLLASLSDGKPYLFLRASVEGNTFLVEMDTNIPIDEVHTADAILRATLKSIATLEAEAPEPRSYYDDGDDEE